MWETASSMGLALVKIYRRRKRRKVEKEERTKESIGRLVSTFWCTPNTKDIRSPLLVSVAPAYTHIQVETDTWTHSNMQIVLVCLFPTVWTLNKCKILRNKKTLFALSNREIVLWSSSISCTTPCVSTSPCTEWVSALSCWYSFSSPHTDL